MIWNPILFNSETITKDNTINFDGSCCSVILPVNKSMYFLWSWFTNSKKKIYFKMKCCLILTLLPLVLSKSLENDHLDQKHSGQ